MAWIIKYSHKQEDWKFFRVESKIENGEEVVYKKWEEFESYQEMAEDFDRKHWWQEWIFKYENINWIWK